jgi:N-acetylneuraminic acid mutarotase
VDNTVEIYDTAQQSWSSARTIAYRDWPAAAFFDGKIYVTGGQFGENLRSVQVFDISAGTWSSGRTDLGSERYYHSATAMNGKLYVIGGVAIDSNTGQWLGDSAEMLDPSTGEWTLLPPLPTARYQSATVTVGATLFVIGGGEGSQSFGHKGVFAVMEAYVEGASWNTAWDAFLCLVCRDGKASTVEKTRVVGNPASELRVHGYTWLVCTETNDRAAARPCSDKKLLECS